MQYSPLFNDYIFYTKTCRRLPHSERHFISYHLQCHSSPTNGSHFKINKTKLPKIFLTVAAAKSLDRGANNRVCNSCYKYTYRASRNHKYLLFGQLKKKTQPSTVVVVWCRYHRKNLHLTGSVFLAWSFTPGLSHRSATTTTTTFI